MTDTATSTTTDTRTALIHSLAERLLRAEAARDNAEALAGYARKDRHWKRERQYIASANTNNAIWCSLHFVADESGVRDAVMGRLSMLRRRAARDEGEAS